MKQFYEKHGRLPVPGGLPDMKAQSNVYIKLQNLYKDKARADAKEVLDCVRNTPGGADIDLAELELFCTNARFIKLINGDDGGSRTLAEITGKSMVATPGTPPGLRSLCMLTIPAATEQELGNDDIAAIAGPVMPYSLVGVYLALTATTTVGKASAEDIKASIVARVPAAEGKERIMKAAEEVARTEGMELHNISAVIGGMVAQEMIKIITKQYIPIDNTCVFDGIDSRCQVLRL